MLTDLLRRIRDDRQGVTITVMGQGYVGLPLAIEFSRAGFVVHGFDVSTSRIDTLRRGTDPTGLYSDADMQATNVHFTDDPACIEQSALVIVAVPTDVDASKVPDLGPFRRAAVICEGEMPPGCVVIVESTVYPGATEEVFVPLLERHGKVRNRDFWYGFSPERVVPGKVETAAGTLNGAGQTLRNTVKVVSGSTPAVAEAVDALYRCVVDRTYVAPSVKTAEACKIVENVQRDVNIGIMNELAVAFHALGVDLMDVLDAAGTKFNFHPYRPGLVGGHCISVDPWYLVHRAKAAGVDCDVIRAVRTCSDGMASFCAREIVRQASRLWTSLGTSLGTSVMVLGATFKENCNDHRNSQVPLLVDELRSYGMDVRVCDPWLPADELRRMFNPRVGIVDLQTVVNGTGTYDVVVLAVPHRQFGESKDAIVAKCSGLLADIKSAWSDLRGVDHLRYWRL